MFKSVYSPRQLGMLLVSIAFWAFLLNSVTMAVGIIALIAVHEVGHMIAAKRLGLQVSLPEFTPMGAYVRVVGERSIEDESYIKLAGPLVGGLASVGCMVLGYVLSLPQLFEVGLFGVFLNLVNLIPLDPLDGGAFGQYFGRFAWLFGGAIFLWVFWMLYQISPANLVFGAFIGLAALGSVRARSQQWQEQPAYFQMSGGKRVLMLLAYGLTGIGLYAVYNHPQLISSLAMAIGLR